MAIHPSFFEYMSDTFFANEPEEFALFQKSLLRPLRKTIRINTNQRDIPSFISEKTAEGWVFSPTPNGHVFHVDRTNRELALGSTPEHLR
jgi:16S rRNA C967 or C1407 C5-methylase (RsmB/RsmF family)